MTKRDRAYVMAFVANDGGVYAVHPTDDIKHHGTFEYIDFKFSLPHSYYIFLWRRDEKKFTEREAEDIRKFVEWDMSDFINDGDGKEGKGYMTKVVKKLEDKKNCLILAWDKMDLPDDVPDWELFVDDVADIVTEELGNIAEGTSQHDKELAVYEGRLNDADISREFLR